MFHILHSHIAPLNDLLCLTLSPTVKSIEKAIKTANMAWTRPKPIFYWNKCQVDAIC